MNKIYKVIYSKVRNCYVVVSELAKNNGKGTSRGAVVGSPKRTSLLAAVLALGLTACDSLPDSGGHTVKPSTGSSQPFEMHFIDVGQALSVLVECDGQFMLYDGGNVDDGSLVVSYLQKQGVEQLQYVFCSHAHEDHVGGLAAVMAKFPAGHAYSPVTESSTKCFNDFVKYTQQQGLQLEVPSVGTVWPLGSATVTLLGPVTGYSETNNTSLVLRIDYGSTSFLLTGDMEKTAETDLVNSGANLKADVLQVGHHGSSTSTSYVFLNAVLSAPTRLGHCFVLPMLSSPQKKGRFSLVSPTALHLCSCFLPPALVFSLQEHNS